MFELLEAPQPSETSLLDLDPNVLAAEIMDDIITTIGRLSLIRPSCAAAKNWLGTLRDPGGSTAEECDTLIQEVESLSPLLQQLATDIQDSGAIRQTQASLRQAFQDLRAIPEILEGEPPAVPFSTPEGELDILPSELEANLPPDLEALLESTSPEPDAEHEESEPVLDIDCLMRLLEQMQVFKDGMIELRDLLFLISARWVQGVEVR